jgi:hypothetical protein
LQTHNTSIDLDIYKEMSDNNIQMKKDLKAFMYKLRIEADIDVVDMVIVSLNILYCNTCM